MLSVLIKIPPKLNDWKGYEVLSTVYGLLRPDREDPKNRWGTIVVNEGYRDPVDSPPVINWFHRNLSPSFYTTLMEYKIRWRLKTLDFHDTLHYFLYCSPQNKVLFFHSINRLYLFKTLNDRNSLLLIDFHDLVWPET